ncbi:hypothetical protein Pelo_9011 [Pelomyxa schiedti]|nr:hypothetical protein Pelo_9011 [Pelomyxa schiedti]
MERNQWNTERTQLQNLLNLAENKIKQNEEEGDGVLAVNETNQQQQMRSEALCELSTAFKVATKLRSQLKKAAPLLVSLEHSVSMLKQFLESATERNLSLEVHLKDLSTLRKELEKVLEQSDTRCKQVLGQTLTVESSESEIQQCSRNLSSLMKKLLGINTLPSSGRNEEKERGTREVPTKDINNLMSLKPWLLNSLEPPPPSSSSTCVPFSLLLREITTDTVLSTQGGGYNDFDKCHAVIDQHTVLHKECTSQAALGQRLHKEIEDLLSTCQGLNEAHNRKYMLMRGLEGDEQFMSHPDVWSQLSDLLPRSLQSVMDVMVSKSTAGSMNSTTTTTTTTMPTQPGCTASVVPTAGRYTQHAPQQQPQTGIISGVNSSSPTGGNVVMMCIECDERPPNVQFQPCGHVVLCTQCAATVRKCPHCRAPIKTKTEIP